MERSHIFLPLDEHSLYSTTPFYAGGARVQESLLGAGDAALNVADTRGESLVHAMISAVVEQKQGARDGGECTGKLSVWPQFLLFFFVL